jgi:histone deacetylase complex regulatory component SIN3
MQLMVSDMQHVSPVADMAQNGGGNEELIVVVVQAPRRADKTVIDALAYLDLVKACFRGNPAIYQSFLDMMGDFKMNRSVCFSALLLSFLQSLADLGARHRITALEVCHRIISLFGSHPHLIIGFNKFLPDSYHLQVHSDGTASVLTSL